MTITFIKCNVIIKNMNDVKLFLKISVDNTSAMTTFIKCLIPYIPWPLKIGLVGASDSPTIYFASFLNPLSNNRLQ